MAKDYLHTLSVVVPVYKGDEVLEPLINEIVDFYGDSGEIHVSEFGHKFSIKEIVLVNDYSPDESAEVMRKLQVKFKNLKCIWLARNFGQHAATLAGIAETSGDWIVTLDEDGQQDPKYFPNFLDQAVKTKSQIVYARPTNNPPHGVIRNGFSRIAKRISKLILASTNFENFNSYRLILGEPARALSQYGGTGIYLDAGLIWVTSSASTCDVELRNEGRPSGYSLSSLVGHFGRLVVTAGARPLRIIAILGLLVATGGFALTAYIVWMKAVAGVSASGWTSVIVAVLVTSGLTMLSLGVISEFLGAVVRTTMGKPLFLKVSDPNEGPLGNAPETSENSVSD